LNRSRDETALCFPVLSLVHSTYWSYPSFGVRATFVA
jgi:hypothetical protein